MEKYDVIRLALVLAKQAEIEGMKAENITAEQNGHSLPYDGKRFMDQAADLENIANCHDEQL